jgi:hypothetical protein
MALCMTYTCKKCLTTGYWIVNHNYHDVCPQCIATEIEQKRTMHLVALRSLPLEDRISKIEEWIYDYKPPIDWLNRPLC